MTVMLGQLIIIIGAILQASAFSLAQLIVARVVSALSAEIMLYLFLGH